MPAPLADIDPEQFDLGIRVNVRGTFLGMKFEIPAMLDSGGGAIVNMASVAGVRAMTNLGTYVAAKAAIMGLTESAALDYADRGVRVNVVAPGPILTHHLERAGAGLNTRGRFGADASPRHDRRRRRRRAVAINSPQCVVRHGCDGAGRRRPARGRETAADVSPGRRDDRHVGARTGSPRAFSTPTCSTNRTNCRRPLTRSAS